MKGSEFFTLVQNGAFELKANKDIINDLNVFPIPDGDTGDNMFMTINSGCVQAKEVVAQSAPVGQVAEALSKGMLLGARGNSGVILSRIFAGIARGLKDVDELTVADFAHAMSCGVEEAYSSVSVPVEGTILTVLKDAVNKANLLKTDSLENYFGALLTEMDASLERTPDLLPVLKEAGVVDSGGAGLLCIFRGMDNALNGKTLSDETESGEKETQKPQVNLDAFTADSELLFGYCTEFLLRLQRSKVNLDTFDVQEIIDYLNAAGDSVVCFRDGSIVKVHVHTKTPGDILSHCQRWGEFLTLKIENMTLQHHETNIRNAFSKPHKAYGIVTVASGQGLVNAFKEAGADFVIEGGQTMNPSAQSFVEAFDVVSADTIFVFPNNSNIILTAQQAAELYDKSKVIVLPSKTMGAGYVAIASMDLSIKDTEAIVASANETMQGVVCGMVTRATRDTSFDGVNIHKNDSLGICHGDILCDAPNPEEAVIQLCEKIEVADHDVTLVFKGEDSPMDDAEQLVECLQKLYPRTEFIMTDGGQPIYHYIIVLC